MNKIDWKRKLSSRKFWALVAALATSVLALVGAGDEVSVQITGVIGAVGSAIAYILVEGKIDGYINGGNTEE
ncbi:hypothetical protein D3C80_1992720 [compost metagenome]